MSGVRWINRLTRRTVVVHTRDGQSLRGVLVGAYRDCLVLSHAVYLAGEGEVNVDGEVAVPRQTVGWLQVIPPRGE
jgi:small nuclear ribonucleoprotein (snRNP)-like protein